MFFSPARVIPRPGDRHVHPDPPAVKKVFIKTFGCQMNEYDSDKMADVLHAFEGYKTADPADADVVLYNSCSVREKASEKAVQRFGTASGIESGKAWASHRCGRLRDLARR